MIVELPPLEDRCPVGADHDLPTPPMLILIGADPVDAPPERAAMVAVPDEVPALNFDDTADVVRHWKAERCPASS